MKARKRMHDRARDCQARESKLSSLDCVRIAAHASVAPITVARLYGGRRCTATVRERVGAAATALGYPLPPEQNESEVA